jgi:hypothetical protein
LDFPAATQVTPPLMPCTICGTSVRVGNIKRHQRTKMCARAAQRATATDLNSPPAPQQHPMIVITDPRCPYQRFRVGPLWRPMPALRQAGRSPLSIAHQRTALCQLTHETRLLSTAITEAGHVPHIEQWYTDPERMGIRCPDCLTVLTRRWMTPHSATPLCPVLRRRTTPLDTHTTPHAVALADTPPADEEERTRRDALVALNMSHLPDGMALATRWRHAGDFAP